MSENIKLPSFEKVNYLIRPNKQIERKIIIDILTELGKINPIDNYHYIGFGSIYYYDFILFHKYLNMSSMTSLDDKDYYCKRFEFNKPYDFIDFKNVKSTEYLEKIDWNEKIILWFDYDTKLDSDITSDLELISKNSNDNDIFILTLACNFPQKYRDQKNFSENFKKEYCYYISDYYNKPKYLSSKLFPFLLQHVIINIIKSHGEYNDYKFNKIFSFYYRDSVPMITIGGIFSKDISNIKKVGNPFIKFGEEIETINVPLLTYKEKIYLDQQINTIKKSLERTKLEIKNNNIPKGYDIEKEIMKKINTKILKFELSTLSHLENYLKYYRYYPQYYEGII